MQLNFRQYSDVGEPLLILHGLFGNLANWGAHSKFFAEHYSVFGIDLRNHGESCHDFEMNYPIMAQDIQRLMKRLNIESANFIGHSMGGKVCMELALSQGYKVDKVIVVDIAPVSYAQVADGHLRVIEGMKSLDFDLIRSRNDAEIYLMDFIQDEPTRKFILTNLVAKENNKYKWRLNLESIELNYNRLKEGPSARSPFRKPCLFVKGAKSNYIEEKDKKEILKLFPNAEMKTIMHAGHWVHADKPQVFRNLALEFLQAEKN